MASQRALVTASRRVAQELTKAARDRHTPIHPGIIEDYVNAAGGSAVVARMMRDDMARVRGESLAEEERAGHRYPELVIQKYHQMVLSGSLARDQQLASMDVSAFSEDDLKATLFSLAREIVREDAAFRREVAIEALKDDPNLLAELLKHSSTVITTEAITDAGEDDNEHSS